MMLGLRVAPRWRLPLVLVGSLLMAGCSVPRSFAEDDDGFAVPTVKMALVKFPLNGSTDNNLLDDRPAAERFLAEPRQVAHRPSW